MFNSCLSEKIYIKKIASNLCVKEAFFKSISNKIKSFRFKDVEVLRDLQGKPYINLYNNLEELKDFNKFHVTISNEIDIVTSFVVVESI